MSLQLDSNAAYPKSPLGGIGADAYNGNPQVYEPTIDKSYYVKRVSSTAFYLAETAEDLASGHYVDVAKLSGGSPYRFMPTWHFGEGGLTRVDVANDTINFEALHGFVSQ